MAARAACVATRRHGEDTAKSTTSATPANPAPVGNSRTAAGCLPTERERERERDKVTVREREREREKDRERERDIVGERERKRQNHNEGDRERAKVPGIED